MPRQQGPFDWQGRLESTGTVTFGPARWSSWLLCGVAVVALAGLLLALVTDGPAVWSVVATLVVAGCAVVTGRAAAWGSNQLTVTHDGFRMGRGTTVPFGRLGAVAVGRRALTLHYATSPEERGRQRRMLVSLPRFAAFHPDDLAVWLLKLRGGPAAEVVEDTGSGLSRVFRLKPAFGEFPGSPGGDGRSG